MEIRRDDTVIVLSGKDKGKKGKVLKAFPKEEKLIVAGVNVASRHRKPRNQQEEGGIIKMETPIYASKVQIVCPKCGKAVRVGHKRVTKTVSGKEKDVSVRVCRKCGAEL